MTFADYYQVLGLPADSSVEDIKRAYRQKARMYHPDLNHSPDAKDKFIIVTEAYEFLVANFDKITNTDESYRDAMEYWRKYRKDRATRRANAYARASYINFKKTKFYRATRIFDGTTIILGLSFSVLVIVFTMYGYIYRVHHPIPGFNPVFSMILLLLTGMVFFVVSLVFLKAYIEASAKRRKKR
jgi:curved DNA-binding protein CbpA